MGYRRIADWRMVNEIYQYRGEIISADITGTNSGQFGHANGIPLCPAAPTGFVWEFVSLAWFFKYATAAYTAGGNVTVNWDGGGAAITGLVSAANSFGASADKLGLLVPLAAAYTPLVAATAVNLVAASAFTQPGTAAGYISYKLTLRQHKTGL
jgi:hypothetical protein